MPFIHYLFLGHFEHDGEIVRFDKQPGDQGYKPVVRRPFDMQTAEAIARDVQAAEPGAPSFPPTWLVWAGNGYLICDKYTRDSMLIEFITRLVERTGCDIYDAGAHSVISLSEWLATVREYSRPSASPAGRGIHPASA